MGLHPASCILGHFCLSGLHQRVEKDRASSGQFSCQRTNISDLSYSQNEVFPYLRISKNIPNSGLGLPQITRDGWGRPPAQSAGYYLPMPLAGLPSLVTQKKSQGWPDLGHFTLLHLNISTGCGMVSLARAWHPRRVWGRTYRDKISKDIGTGSQMTCVSIPKCKANLAGVSWHSDLTKKGSSDCFGGIFLDLGRYDPVVNTADSPKLKFLQEFKSNHNSTLRQVSMHFKSKALSPLNYSKLWKANSVFVKILDHNQKINDSFSYSSERLQFICSAHKIA